MTGALAHDPGREAVLALVRMAFGGEPEAEPFEGMSEPEWKEAYSFASRQGVLPLAYDGTAALPEMLRPPKSLMLQWGVNAGMSEERYYRQITAIEKLALLYAADGMEILLMKGYGMSLYYPVPEHRECGDMDVYLFGDYRRGNETAEKAGCRILPVVGKHSSFVFDGIPVENHRIIVDEDRNRRTARIEEILERMAAQRRLERIRVGKASLWIPSPDFNAVYLVAHAASHFSGGELMSVRNLCDWARFLAAEGKNIDMAFLDGTLKGSRLDTLCALMTGFCERHLGLEPQGWPAPGDGLQRKFDELIFRYRTVNPQDETLPQRVGRIWANRWRYREVMHTSFASYLAYAIRKGVANRRNDR